MEHPFGKHKKAEVTGKTNESERIENVPKIEYSAYENLNYHIDSNDYLIRAITKSSKFEAPPRQPIDGFLLVSFERIKTQLAGAYHFDIETKYEFPWFGCNVSRVDTIATKFDKPYRLVLKRDIGAWNADEDRPEGYYCTVSMRRISEGKEDVKLDLLDTGDFKEMKLREAISKDDSDLIKRYLHASMKSWFGVA